MALPLSAYDSPVDLEVGPPPLREARLILEETKKIGAVPPSWTCFQFVNEALECSLTSDFRGKFTQFSQEILGSLEDSHRDKDQALIPYHYYLLTQVLKRKPEDFLHSPDLESAQAGDFFIYIDPAYDPDPTHRPAHRPSGTHVAFIDKILMPSAPYTLRFRLIDASAIRKQGRSFSPLEDQKTCPPWPPKGSVAYSYVSLGEKDREKNLWTCKMDRQTPKEKYISLLRFKF